jgi:hypothetical protein
MYVDPLFCPSRLEDEGEDVSISVQPAFIATALGWLIALTRIVIARRGHETADFDLMLAAAALAIGPVQALGLLLSALGPQPQVDVRGAPRPHGGGSRH